MHPNSSFSSTLNLNWSFYFCFRFHFAYAESSVFYFLRALPIVPMDTKVSFFLTMKRADVKQKQNPALALFYWVLRQQENGILLREHERLCV